MLTLRKYQGEAVEATWHSLQNNDGNTVVALPTGTGKSLVAAELVRQAITRWPSHPGRVMVLASRKELVEQNFTEFRFLCPEIRCGIYAAGLNRRDTREPVIFGQIQSLHHAGGERFGHRDLLILDEAHEVPEHSESMYRGFLASVQTINPACRMIGLSATPFRMSTGSIVGTESDGYLFQQLAYEYPMRRAIEEGHLSPLTTIATPAELHADLSGVHTRGGEFIAGEAERAMLQGELVERTVADMLARTVGRRSGIIFCSGVEHCQRVLKALHGHGERATLVTGETHALNRGWAIEEFRKGACRWLLNVQVLTTGFNVKGVDAVVLLRPTQSAGLLIQMIGRGTRLSPETGKSDCVILDYARNLATHGPIDLIAPRNRRLGGGNGSTTPSQGAPGKVCTNCGQKVHARHQICPYCSVTFPLVPVHEDKPDEAPLFSQSTSDSVKVARVAYRRHIKRDDGSGKPIYPTLRVDYFADDGTALSKLQPVASEWICFSHPEGSYARKKAEAWWSARSDSEVPPNTEVALASVGEITVPTRITVFRKNEKAFAEVRNPVFGEQDPAVSPDELPF